MTKIRAIAYIWVIALASLLGSLSRANGQSEAIKFNPNTGAVVEPSAPSKIPLIFRADVQNVTTDADFTILGTVSLVYVDASFTETRAATLPTIGNDPGEFPPGGELEIIIPSSNGFGVYFGEFETTFLDGARVRLRAYDSSWGYLVIGTAASYDVGTGTSNLPTVSQADTRYVNATGTETIAGAKTFSTSPLTVSGASGPRYFVASTNGGSGQFELGVAGSAGEFITDSQANDGVYKQSAGSAIRFAVGVTPATTLKITATGTTLGASGSEIRSIYSKTGTLSSGTVTITDSNIGASDIVLPVAAGNSSGGDLGVTINAGVGFTVDSTNGSDARAIKCIVFDLP